MPPHYLLRVASCDASGVGMAPKLHVMAWQLVLPCAALLESTAFKETS